MPKPPPVPAAQRYLAVARRWAIAKRFREVTLRDLAELAGMLADSDPQPRPSEVTLPPGKRRRSARKRSGTEPPPEAPASPSLPNRPRSV